MDDLLFGSPNRKLDGSAKTELDILSDVLSNQQLGITESEQDRSFSGQWQSMFGSDQQVMADGNSLLGDDFLGESGLGLGGNAGGIGALTGGVEGAGKPSSNMVDANIKSDRMYMPSFLLDQMRKTDPHSLMNGPPKSALAVKDNDKTGGSGVGDKNTSKGEKSHAKGKDMSAWFNLFADLDPLANPDDVGASLENQGEKQAC